MVFVLITAKSLMPTRLVTKSKVAARLLTSVLLPQASSSKVLRQARSTTSSLIATVSSMASLPNPIQLWQRPLPSSNCLGLTRQVPTAFMTFLLAGIPTSPFPKPTAMALWFQPIQAAMNSVVVSSKARTMLRLLLCTSIKQKLSSRSTLQHSPGAASHSHLTTLTPGRMLTSFTLSFTLKRAKKPFRCLMANHSLNPILSDLSPTT